MRRKVGRHILLFLLIVASFFAGMKYASNRVRSVVEDSPPLEYEMVSRFPTVAKEVQEIRGDTLLLKGNRVVLLRRKTLMEGLAVLDSLLKRGEKFKVVDLRYEGLTILKY